MAFKQIAGTVTTRTVLLIPLAVGACKPEGGTTPSADTNTAGTEAGEVVVTTDTGTGTDTVDSVDLTKAGVTAAEGDVITMGGQLAIGPALTEGAPDSVLAFVIEGGKIDYHSKFVSTAEVASDGTFKLEASTVAGLYNQLKAAIAGDKVDREALTAILGEDLSKHTDAELKTGVQSMINDAERGGVARVLVSMDSKAGGRFEQAQTFRFIGMPSSQGTINGIPVKKAKGNLFLGKISGTGDQALSELAAGAESFDLSEESLASIASSSNAMKIVRNFWINYDPDSKAYFGPTPFYMWQADYTHVKDKFSLPETPVAGGWGMYLKVENAGLTFGDICGYNKPRKTIKLVPPGPIPVGDGQQVTPEAPFSNEGTGQVKSESDRLSCGGSAVGGFYGAGKDENDTGLMINWGGSGAVPEGYFHMYVDDKKVASFELASTSPYGADGKLNVFIPALKVTTGEGGRIDKLEVKVYRRDPATDKLLEVTDPVGFLDLSTDFVAGMTERSDAGEFERRYALATAWSDGTFRIPAAGFIPKDGEAGGTADVWYFGDATSVPAGARKATSLHVQYDMLGSSYRVEFRPPQ